MQGAVQGSSPVSSRRNISRRLLLAWQRQKRVEVVVVAMAEAARGSLGQHTTSKRRGESCAELARTGSPKDGAGDGDGGREGARGEFD